MTDPYIYAALLLHKCKQPITEENVTGIMAQALGGSDKVNPGKVTSLVKALEGVDIEKVTFMPMVTMNTTSPSPVVTVNVPVEDKKKPDKSDDMFGLGQLFGDN